MRQLEKDALRTMLKLSATPVVDREQIAKLDSADFKLGWASAHRRMRETVSFILSAPPADLKRYAAQAK